MIVQGALAVQPSLQFLAHSGFRRLPGSHKVLCPVALPYLPNTREVVLECAY